MSSTPPTTIPEPLKKGDTIAIVSPASKIDPGLINRAADTLSQEGYRVEIMPHARGSHGSYSGTVEQRLADMRQALQQTHIRAILCSRGGYGCVHLLPELHRLPAPLFKKWLIGFSDVSALHALWLSKGFASLHGAMVRHLGLGSSFAHFHNEMSVLSGASPSIAWNAHPLNRPGTSSPAMVTGGNMAVIGGLAGTTLSPIRPGCILVIEDIAEPIYKVERMLWQMRLSGTLEKLAGMVVGQFTDYRPSADYPDMYTMIQSMVEPYGFPVAFNAPFGHIEANAPLLLNTPATLTVDPRGASLSYPYPAIV